MRIKDNKDVLLSLMRMDEGRRAKDFLPKLLGPKSADMHTQSRHIRHQYCTNSQGVFCDVLFGVLVHSETQISLASETNIRTDKTRH